MATRSIAFRLNDKNREDKEIMDWLDKVVYEGGYVAVPAMMQMQEMNVAPISSETSAEPTESGKETVEELPENNLELSDKPLDDGALASLSAMFGDDEED